MKTARFWEHTGNGWVKLSLKDGEAIELHEGGPHEEGYSYTYTVFERDGNARPRR